MPMFQGTVKVPGLGEVKKGYLAVAGAGVATIVGIGYYRKRQAANIPVTTTQTSTDAFGSTTPIGPGGSNGVTNQFGDPLPAPIVQSPNPGIITNQDWLSEAESLNIGIPADAITIACSRILGGLPVTSAQADIYHQIVGVIGPPPQSTPTIKLTSTPPPPPVKVPPPPTTPKLTNSYNALGQSMLRIEQIAHPGASLVDSERRALEAIHYNIANGRNRWPGGIAGKDLINRRISGKVYVV